jgi:hypothetical protein
MRKLGLKLGLSCAALAACATTLVSTTFAWYTSNDTVKAEGITGKTNEKDATLLLISDSAKVGQWGASINVNTSAVTLDPVAYAGTTVKTNNSTLDAGSYYTWDGKTNKEGGKVTGGTAASNGYISFYVYFKSGSSADLKVQVSKFDLRNTTTGESLPTKSVLATGTGAGTNTYYVDMLYATNVVVTIGNGTEVESSATASPLLAADDEETRTAYSCDSIAAKTTGDNAPGKGTNTGSNANAHTYYNNVKNAEINDKLTSSEKTVSDIATLTKGDYIFSLSTGAGADSTGLDNILMVRFDIYLDGWDKMCFDACRQQTFALDMEFQGIEKKANSGENSGSGN